MLEINKIYLGNCLNLMPEIETGSIDMILCDLPYGTTACKWDTIIPFEPLWEQYKRIIKPNGAIVLFGSEPFSSALRMSNIKNYKYDWIWEKEQGVNFQLCKHQPLKIHENISVFSNNKHLYFPQYLKKINKIKSNKKKGGNLGHQSSEVLRNKYIQQFSNYPKSIQKINRERGFHPTQKPVLLMEYLIKTYTNEGELVLDNCIGSGTTAIGCLNTKRNFIGMEQEQKYFDIANKRIADLQI